MSNRCISLTIPEVYSLPEFYESAEPVAVGEALRIGASLYSTVRAVQTSANLAKIEEEKAAEIERIQKAARHQIQELDSQLSLAEATQSSIKKEFAEKVAALTAQNRTDAATLQKEYAEKITALTAQNRTDAAALQKEHSERITAMRAQNRIDTENAIASATHSLNAQVAAAISNAAGLLERRVQVEASRDADIARAEQRTFALMTAHLEEKQRAVDRLEREKEKLTSLLEKNTAEITTLNDFVRKKSQNAKVKGGEFESLFREHLIAAYGTGPNFNLEDTAKNGIGHAGDYLMYWGDNTILWEVKNYDKPVPTAEVDKFHRDVKGNATVKIGVIVSRYTPITGKNASGDRTVEFISGKMLIYLSNFEGMAEGTLSNLMLLFKTWWELGNKVDSSESMENALRCVERLHTDAQKAKTEWRLHKARNEEMIRWFAESVDKSEERLATALKALQGKNVKNINIPLHIFRDVTGEEKSVELIQQILGLTEENREGSCVLNELAEVLGKKQNLSRDTIRGHIRALLQEEAYEQPRGKNPAKVKGLVLRATDS